ncbi:alpha/beta hydrolase [Thermocatellispora tengchongensis]|nr:alpha/beta hydrolase [Thermocatellispora tengchongensis]
MTTNASQTSAPPVEPPEEAVKAVLDAAAAAETFDSPVSDDAIPLWPHAAPGSEDWTHREQAFKDPVTGGLRIRNVVVPTITPYLPEPAAATGAAVIVAPGGGFFMLSMDNEGSDVAEWLRRRGVAAFLLKYRLKDSGPAQSDFATSFVSIFAAARTGESPAGSVADVTRGVPALALDDLRRAIALLRERAGEWRIDPGRVGVIGFSAGAYLSAGAAVSAQTRERPDFVACVYGGYSHVPVPEQAPPLFTTVAADDSLCFADTMRLIEAWQAAGRPVEAHVYPSGGHGFGLSSTGHAVDTWPERFQDWLSGLGVIVAGRLDAMEQRIGSCGCRS